MLTLFLIMFIALGGLFIGFSLPLIKHKVPPNVWYGFRVRRTLNDPSVWYPANAYAAQHLLWVGVAVMLAAVAAYCVPGMELPVYASIVAATAVVGLIITLVQSFAFLGRLTGEKRK